MSSKNFSKWYEKNKEKLAEKRAARYHSDPEYRAKSIEQSRSRRKAAEEPLCPEGYAYNFQQLAEHLDMSIWTLRDWRRKNFFPEPYMHRGRQWFKEDQAQWLMQMRGLLQRGAPTKERSVQLQDLVELIYSNW